MKAKHTLEGRGVLLEHGRLIAHVDYHLAPPSHTHLFSQATSSLKSTEPQHLSGFILLPTAKQDLPLRAYTLELANKERLSIVVERRYKKIRHGGEARISFWVKVVQGQ